MPARVLPACLACLLCHFSLFLSPALRADEQIFVSGGPALRYFEKHKVSSHDKFWGNFIHAGVLRYNQIKEEIPKEDTFTWMVFRPSYESRMTEAEFDVITEVENRIRPTGAKVVWFSSRDEFIEYINRGQDRSKVKISRLEYFGHSNKRNWMFDYSNRLDGAVAAPLCLHINDLPKLNHKSFAPNAYTRSWGCHSGEEYTNAWQRATGARMIGAVGKTDYSGGGIPVISTPGGYWTK
ncbi:MAG: hypothetical protein SFU85_10470 [Candidatus Methylacidiphilales bacterium]|nr:hypothetical protein [Candidatus Methylacidiphilales bacterium]